jgi:hypothetical protein
MNEKAGNSQSARAMLRHCIRYRGHKADLAVITCASAPIRDALNRGDRSNVDFKTRLLALP